MGFAKSAVPAIFVLSLLAGCASAPAVDEATPAPAPASGEKPAEIELNLPQAPSCDCTPEAERDYTFLEKGFSALSRGEYEDALEYFQRYRRMESSAAADWEADIAIAFAHSLSEGPAYDPDEARKSFRDLRKVDWKSMELHEQTLLMRQSLETFLLIERENRDLEDTNRTLRKDLEKREEALKRLRELTLGQTGSTP